MKKTTLVITRAPKTPASISRLLEAGESIFQASVVDPSPDADSIKKLLAAKKPALILLDGEYGLRDANLLGKLGKLSKTDLALRYLERKDWPESLKVLDLINVYAEEGTSVIIFLNNPSKVLVEALKKAGATTVWKTLDTPSETEDSVYEVIKDLKTMVGGGKSLVTNLRRAFTKV